MSNHYRTISPILYVNIITNQGQNNRIEIMNGTQVVRVMYLKDYRAFSRTETRTKTTLTLVPKGFLSDPITIQIE